MRWPGFKSWAFSRGLALYARRQDAFPVEYIEELGERVLSSPYLADNNLNYRFSGTRGFAIVFRRDGLARVHAEFPEFSPYLDEVLDSSCNAFFLNPLVIGCPITGREAVGVAPHVDRSLRSLTRPIEPPNPRRVTVLYVRVPPGMTGGRLHLYFRLLPVGRITPRPNMLLEFQGGLRHEVRAARFPPDSQSSRVSLVCEHYVLGEEALSRVPSFTVRSTSSFEAFLAAEMRRDD